ncbi:MAG TPA: type II secretion system F family protein, partial [Clostridia bacterium]|nr:type II secretion system F family protein [Clostridia bacterium]
MSQLFSYRIREQNGKTSSGLLRANNITSAARALQEDNYIVTDIRPANKLLAKYGSLQNLIYGKAKMVDLSLYCRQFATMIEAGVPVTSALGVLAKQTGNKALSETSAKMVILLKEGRTLTEAIEQYHFVFPKIFGKLIGVGEMTGNLGGSLKQLGEHFEKEYSLREKVKTAMFYPTLVLGISFITTTVLVFFVLPQLVDVMIAQDIDLPFTTKSILLAAGFISGKGIFLFILLLIFFFTVRYYFGTEKGGGIYDKLKLQAPLVGSLYRKEMTCRFSRNLAILIRCGVPIVHSLDIVGSIMDNRTIKKIIQETKVSIT